MDRKPVTFASNDWILLAEQLLNELIADRGSALDGYAVRVCEVFRGLPEQVCAEVGNDRQAWFFEVRDGQCFVGKEERDDVDMKVVAQYEAVLPLAKTIYTDDQKHMAKVAAMRANLEREGSVQVIGSREELPAPIAELLAELHNRLAVLTR